MDTFKEIREKAAVYKAMVKEEGKRLLGEHFKQIFTAEPTLRAIRWTQYTPYFNDGDACVFGVHGFYYRFEDTPEDAGDYEDGFDYIDYNDKRRSTFKKYEDIPDDVMETVFGDHVQVTATRDGFDVEEYSHD